jgi:hypothetical protein
MTNLAFAAIHTDTAYDMATDLCLNGKLPDIRFEPLAEVLAKPNVLDLVVTQQPIARSTTARSNRSRHIAPFAWNIVWPVIFSWLCYVTELVPGIVILGYLLGCLTTVLSLAYSLFVPNIPEYAQTS